MRQFSTDHSSEGNPLETIQPSISESFMTKYHIREGGREGASTSYASFFHDPACVAHHLSAVKPLQHPSLHTSSPVFALFASPWGGRGRTTPHRDLIAIRNVAYKKSPDEHWFGRFGEICQRVETNFAKQRASIIAVPVDYVRMSREGGQFPSFTLLVSDPAARSHFP